jgi:hypothetical protein
MIYGLLAAIVIEWLFRQTKIPLKAALRPLLYY